MPVPVQTYLFAAILLFATAMAPLAHAEMTDADKAGMRAFTACMEETSDDEGACLEKLGRYAWYPRADAACEAIATRVGMAISGGGLVRWRDLFPNERCARLNMSHDRIAARAGNRETPDSEYAQCVREVQSPSICAERLGRHRQYPTKPGFCYFNRDMIELMHKRQKLPLSWKELFENERCQRLQMPYFDQSRY